MRDQPHAWLRVLPYVSGAWLAVTVVKFGNPVIFANQVEAPTTGLDFLISSWPSGWAYTALVLFFAACIPVVRPGAIRHKPILALPAVWLVWQLVSLAQSEAPALSKTTVIHFAGCVVCFYAGLYAVSRIQNLRPVWVGVLLGLFLMVRTGFDQHFGGLEATRREYNAINWTNVPPEVRARMDTPEFRRKMESNRIFGTFVYPNAFAGGLLLFLPISLLAVWELSRRLSVSPRGALTFCIGGIAMACLIWSGSKAGWLIALGMGLLAFWRCPFIHKKGKLIVGVVVLIGGLAGFFIKYSGYFSRGATSTTARFDYWKAATKVAVRHPVLGTGPGTFMVEYKKLKPPEAEMARLAHNDYLQQACDSGLIGFLAFAGFILGSVTLLYRSTRAGQPNSDGNQIENTKSSAPALSVIASPPAFFALWLGVAGFAVQSSLEFGLYIPALAWPFFLFIGVLWGWVLNRGQSQ